MKKKQKIESDVQQRLVYPIFFWGYLLFCFLLPTALIEVQRYSLFIFIQLIVSGLFIHHWHSRTNYSIFYSGPKSEVYAQIDKIQFKQTRYLSLGFKTREPFSLGVFNNEKLSKILAERYDITLFIIAFLGEVLVFAAIQDQFSIKRGLFSTLIKECPFAKNIFAGLGGYVFLFGFSLFIFGLVSRFIDMKVKK